MPPRPSRLSRALASLEPPLAPEREHVFRDGALEIDARHARILFVGLGVLNAVWTLSDHVVLAGTPLAANAFGHYRWVFSLVALAGGALVTRRFGAWRRATIPLVGLVLATLIAYGMGRLGGPATPWFHFANLAVLPTIALSMSPFARAAFLTLLGACLTGALVVASPGATESPFWPIYLSLHVCLLLLVGASGILVGRARRTTFAARDAIERHAEELRSLNASLEGRVRAQTDELRRLARSLEDAREADRARLARDLHDALGQELGALRYALALAERRFQRDPASIGQDLVQLREQLARTSEASRRIMLDLRPHLLEDLGLTAAAEWLVRRLREQSGLACTLELPEGAITASPEVSLGVFRLLQEALTNAAKHARATRVVVDLSRTADAVRLSVQDDGIGLPPAASRPGGLGLVGMRERVLALGGELDIESAPGEGTTVIARLPDAGPQALTEENAA